MVSATGVSPGVFETPIPDTPERLLRRLEWTVVRPLDGRLQGDYRTLFRGVGMDLHDLREYEPGDDPRHIDWNVTARTDVPFVRVFAEDREVTAWLLLDRSASMGFGPRGRTKHDVLAELATTLAHVLVRGGNRVGAMLSTAGVERTIPPRQGRVQVLRIAREVLGVLGPAGAAAREPTDLARLLGPAAGLAVQRSVVVVISDFVSRPGWERPLALLARRHDVVAIHLADRREHDIPDAGVIALEDPETGDHVLVDTGDPAFRARLRELTADRDARLRASVGEAGIPLHTVWTDDDLVSALVKIAQQRARWRR